MAELLHYIEINPNFTQEALDFLISQFKGKENIEKLLAYMVSPEEEYHELLIATSENYLLEIARDWFLDEIGSQYGVSRDGMDDDDYRARIKALSQLSIYKGTWRETIKLFENVLGTEGLGVSFTNPGTINVRSPSINVHKISNKDIFDKLIPAGIRVRVIAISSLPPLRLGSITTPTPVVGCNSVTSPSVTAGHASSLYHASA